MIPSILFGKQIDLWALLVEERFHRTISICIYSFHNSDFDLKCLKFETWDGDHELYL